MLDCATPVQGPGNYRALKIALKTVKTCTENRLLELSQKIIEIVAIRLDAFKKSQDECNILNVTSVTIEYYTIRVYLAWLQGRLDIAEHLFSQIPDTIPIQKQKGLCELCYRIGSSTLGDHQYNTSAKWLQRALDTYHHDGTNDDKEALQYAKVLVLHASVRANLHLEGSDCQDRLTRSLQALRKVTDF
ncbi:hypothetical protein BDV25DRAFT_161002 [Aspergillus avenaceus]|uniref:Protein ZIP4 homolog n=1 Tax=Aspergillus avenaceus TaxID=36643 RepID=A0A5N6TM11_ASPAV|nr:hypothetical protein BDV25DRAFT_161002 [Aspergillus avenaceus]